MLRTLIIDDESHMRDTLSKIVMRFCPQVSVIGEADSVENGVVMILNLHPGLVLMDIHLKDGTGFEILKALDQVDFKVIFISAFDKKTILAFRLSNVPYLLKPVNPVELAEKIRDAPALDQDQLRRQLKVLHANMKAIQATAPAR